MQLRWFPIAISMTLAAPALAGPTFSSLAVERPPPVETVDDAALPDAATILVDRPRDDRVVITRSAFSVREVEDTAIVSLTLTAGSHELLWHETHLAVRLPPGARVVGMAFQEAGAPQSAEIVEAAEARERFEKATQVSVDPALLEQVATLGPDRYQLTMYPVSLEQRATATLTIAMPRARQILVDVAGARRAFVAGQPSAATLADQALLAAEPVSATRAFYSAPFEPTATPGEIRNAMRSRTGDFAGCHQRRSGVDANVMVHLTVGTDGSTHVDKIDGANEMFALCLAGIIDNLAFRTGDVPVRVKYPIHFTVE